jgi:hypothetical protein
MEADISIWQKTGHFYFALTRSEKGSEKGRLGLPLIELARVALI